MQTHLSANEDWRFLLADVRDAAGDPLDLTGFDLRLQFRPASLRGYLIADLEEGSGLTVSAGGAGQGPTISVVARACNRSWFPLVDTPVVGDLMLYRGDVPDRDSILVMRLTFTATWGSTRV